jgi:hypothetical protein
MSGSTSPDTQQSPMFTAFSSKLTKDTAKAQLAVLEMEPHGGQESCLKYSSVSSPGK